MNEPWLIGQSSQMGEKGNFQQFNQGGTAPAAGQTTGQNSGQTQGVTSNQTQSNTQTQSGNPGQQGMNGQFQGRGNGFPGGEGTSSGSFMSIVKGLHEGRIGTTNVKWLVDLTAIAMIFLTGSGIILSIRVLRSEKVRKNRKAAQQVV